MSEQSFTRRRFAALAGAGAAAVVVASRGARAQSPAARLKFAVIGINHEHIFRMVKAVTDGGGALSLVYAEGAEPKLAEKFFREHSDVKVARSEAEVLEDEGVKLVVTAAKPAERAQVGIRVMKAGKDVLADKGGFLNLAGLDEARRVQAVTKRIYSISYSERLLEPATMKASELVAAGAIGRVVQTLGIGPHGLLSNPREDWFWTRAGRGGMFADVGTHQADQFLHFTGSTRGEVTAARAENYQNPDHPEFEDFGEVMFAGDGGKGYAMVDYYRTRSLGGRLTITGTEGSLEVWKSEGRVTVANGEGKREVTVEPGTVCPFGTQLVDDVLNRTETAMGQAHAFLATELAVRAQMLADKGS